MNRLATVAAVVAAAISPVRVESQNIPNLPIPIEIPEASASAHHAALGLELSFLVPRGDFAPGNPISVGYGVRGGVGTGPHGMVDIGAAFRSIAHDSHTYDDSVEIKNMLRTLSVSGRLAAPLRVARPYIGASVGLAYFGTERRVERCCDEEGGYAWEFDGVEAVDFLPTASTRVGLLIDVSGDAGQPVLSLDLGMENHYGRAARYQVGGLGDVRHSGTSYRVFSLGLTVRSR